MTHQGLTHTEALVTTVSNVPQHDGDTDRLLSRRELRRYLPVSDMTIWRWQQAGSFPQHVTIGGRNFWREREVRAFLEDRFAARDRLRGARLGGALC